MVQYFQCFPYYNHYYGLVVCEGFFYVNMGLATISYDMAKNELGSSIFTI
jgi:hypothetical protein